VRTVLFFAAIFIWACTRDTSPQQAEDTDTAKSSENEEDTGAPTDTGTEPDTREPATLLVAPLVYATTTDGFTVSAVTASGDPTSLRLYVQEDGSQWEEITPPVQKNDEVIEWRVTDRLPGAVCPYAIVSDSSQLSDLDDVKPRDRNTPPPETGVDADGGLTDDVPYPRRGNIETPVGNLTLPFVGQIVTQRAPSEGFRFALIADSHLRHHDTVETGMTIWNNEEAAFFYVASDVAKELPDFIVHLGDIVDYRLYGFNDPPPTRKSVVFRT
jgi:hypothetical protein